MDCQLEELPEAGEELSIAERLRLGLYKRYRYIVRNGRRVASDPSLLLDKLKRLSNNTSATNGSTRAGERSQANERLGLEAGERVRVRPIEDILETLDERRRCGGLPFMSLMSEYCGGTYSVRKRVDRFFDERTRRFLKARDVVILDEVFCEPPRDGGQAYAGCARTCFFFWKEAWLERVSRD